MNATVSKKPNPLVKGDLVLFQDPCDVLGPSCGQTTADSVGDIAALASLYQKGMRKMIFRMTQTQPGDTPNWRRLRKSAMLFNRLLESRGLGTISVRKLRPDHPLHARLTELMAGPEQPARRSLLARVRAQFDHAEADAQDDLTVLQQTERQRGGALFAAVPVLDPGRCSACDACTRACPTGALSLVSYTDRQAAYRISPEFCNGCELCTDICDTDAISISLLAPAVPELELATHSCPACHAQFHLLRDHARATGQSHCQVCTQTGHYKKLHQVWTT